jgi:hypothetical protein
MDDERGSGHSRENACQVHRPYVSKQQYLGIQDAPRKTRPPSEVKCGAWAGTVIRITKDQVTRSVTQAKWDKGKEIIKWFREKCDAGEGYSYKQVLSKKGFLVHLYMTYIPFSSLFSRAFICSQIPGEPTGELTAGKCSLKSGNLIFSNRFWMEQWTKKLTWN